MWVSETGKDRREQKVACGKGKSHFPLAEAVRNFYILVKSIIWCYPQLYEAESGGLY
jgi:hypothetical protein